QVDVADRGTEVVAGAVDAGRGQVDHAAGAEPDLHRASLRHPANRGVGTTDDDVLVAVTVEVVHAAAYGRGVGGGGETDHRHGDAQHRRGDEVRMKVHARCDARGGGKVLAMPQKPGGPP